MTKRQLIDEIITANQTAEPGFLAQFDDSDLREYLRHLRWAKQPRLIGDGLKYDKYFTRKGQTPAPDASAGQPDIVLQPVKEAPPPTAVSAQPPPRVEAPDEIELEDLTEPEIETIEHQVRNEARFEEDFADEALPLAAGGLDEIDAQEEEPQEQEPSPFAQAQQPQQQEEAETQTWLF